MWLVSLEIGREYQIPGNGVSTKWVLGIEPMFSSGAAGTLNHWAWAVSSLVFLRKLLLKRSGLELLTSHYISSFWAHEDSLLGKLKRDAIVEQVYRDLPWLSLDMKWRNDYLGVRAWRFQANNFLFTSKIKVSAPTLLEAVFLLTCIPQHNIKQLTVKFHDATQGFINTQVTLWGWIHI